ncbi:heme A synthase [Bacillaceae bacterium]
MKKGLKWLAVTTTVGMFLVLLMGALVTKTDSRDGCGDDWPLCNGKFVPAYTFASLVEYSHRAVSGIEGVLIVTFAVWGARALRKSRAAKAARWSAYASVFFTFLQAALGAMAVVWGQSKAVLALHFGISLAAFASVLLLAILVFQHPQESDRSRAPVTKTLKYGVLLLTGYTVIVVYLGAYVRHTEASLACADWPLCNGEWIPPLSGLTGIQFAHRFAAALLLFATVWLYGYVKRHVRSHDEIYKGSFAAFILAVLQVLSGGVSVLTKLHLVSTLIHTTLISFYFGVLSYLCLLVLSAKEAEESPELPRGKVVTE